MNQPLSPFLVVRTGGTLYALPVAQVNEVLRPPALTAAGEAATGLLGVVRLRGQATAVFDLATLLGRESPTPSTSAGQTQGRLVSLRLGEQTAAFLVDEVLGLQTLSEAELAEIDLPRSRELTVGRFDAGFASVISLSAVLPPDFLAVGLPESTSSAELA